MKALVLALLLVPTLASEANAEDSFESRAQTASRVDHIEDVVWALTASCDKGDDVQQRQCRAVRERRAKELAGATLLVEGDPGALELGPWSSAKKSIPVIVSGCIRCGGVDVDGHTWFVTSVGPKGDRGKVRAPNLYDNVRQIADEAGANTWKTFASNSRFELIVKAPKKVQVGDKDALTFDVVAWRVVNACDGNVVVSSLPSGAAPADKKACAAPAPVGDSPTDTTPESLTPAMVQDAMRPVVAAARLCFTQFKVSGKTKIDITITADGAISKHELVGDFTGTPTGKCIDEAIKKATFPKTKKSSTRIGFPLVLQ